MNQDLVSNPLWDVLAETVKSLPLFKNHKAYTRDRILLDSPAITPEELAMRLTISLGEAYVILYEIEIDKQKISKKD